MPITPYFGVQSFRNFYDNIPYGGQGGMEWITKRGVFSTPMVIKLIPIRDMSIPPSGGGEFSPFDALVCNVRDNLPRGSKVKESTERSISWTGWRAARSRPWVPRSS